MALDKTETGWLIECIGTPHPIWYAAGPRSRWEWQRTLDTPYAWTTDASKALRFARKEDAETLIHLESFQQVIATEHAWCD